MKDVEAEWGKKSLDEKGNNHEHEYLIKKIPSLASKPAESLKTK